MKKYEIKINVTTLIIIVGVIIGLFFINNMINSNRSNELKRELQQQRNLSAALMDSMRVSINTQGELVATKLTLQAKIDDLMDENLNLSASQRELINRINEVQRDNKVITAALVNTQFKIDSLFETYAVVVDTVENQINFSDETEHLTYDITVTNVRPVIPTTKPRLLFNKFNAENDYFITFNWDDDKRNRYPVSFSILNTNPLFETMNIESYAIPELSRDDLFPTNWQKFLDWSSNNKLLLMAIPAIPAAYYLGRAVGN